MISEHLLTTWETWLEIEAVKRWGQEEVSKTRIDEIIRHPLLLAIFTNLFTRLLARNEIKVQGINPQVEKNP